MTDKMFQASRRQRLPVSIEAPLSLVQGWLAVIESLFVGRRIAWIFVALALPGCIFLVIATPPFQTPDAPSHFLRAYQVSQGGLIGTHVGKSAGGFIDSGVVAFGELEEPLKFHVERKWTQALANKATDAKLSGDKRPTEFGNTAPYPPLNYAPQALAFVVLGYDHAPLLPIYRLACLLNAICAIGLTVAALQLARRTRALIFVISLLPMTQAQMASVSPDATLIPFGFLIIAWFDRLCVTRQAITGKGVFLLGVLTVMAAIARIPYIAFALLFLHPQVYFEGANSQWRKRFIVAGTVIAVSLGLYLIQTHLAGGTIREGSSMRAQTAYLLGHLSFVPELIYRTLVVYGDFYMRTFVGVLGWLDTYFSNGFYVVSYIVIGMALIFPALESEADNSRPTDRLATLWPLMPLAMSIALIFFGLYAFWSAVGAKEIEGVQGRYFLPIFPMIAMTIMPLLSRRIGETNFIAAVKACCVVVFLIFPIFSYFNLVHKIVGRFYIG